MLEFVDLFFADSASNVSMPTVVLVGVICRGSAVLAASLLVRAAMPLLARRRGVLGGTPPTAVTPAQYVRQIDASWFSSSTAFIARALKVPLVLPARITDSLLLRGDLLLNHYGLLETHGRCPSKGCTGTLKLYTDTRTWAPPDSGGSAALVAPSISAQVPRASAFSVRSQLFLGWPLCTS